MKKTLGLPRHKLQCKMVQCLPRKISIREGKPLKLFEFDDHGEMLSLVIGNASLAGYERTLSGF